MLCRPHERPWLFLLSSFKNYLGLVTTTRSQQVSSFPSQQPPVGESQKALKASLASLLRSSCGTRTTLTVAHHHIIRSGHDGSPFLANLLIGLYGKYGSLQEVCSVFDSLQQKNVFSWTMIIDVYAQHGQGKKSLLFYQRMLKEDIKPDRVLFLCVLGVCSNLKDLAYGTEVHAAIARVGLDVDVVVRTALVNMYGKCGSLGNATLVFNSSEERDAILCNAIMTAYNQHGHAEETFQVHERMQLEGLKPNESTFVTVLGACGILASVLHTKAVHVCLIHCGYESHVVVGTALINTYNKCGSLEDASKVFESIPQGDTILCNTMIVAFTQHGQYKDALNLYQRMQKQGLKPSQVTFVCSLCAVTEPSSLPQGKEIHTRVIEHGYEPNAFVVTALISMYAKCGSLEDAQEVFDRVPLQNVASWTAIIAAYAQYGHTQEAFQLYQQMLAEGIYSDKCTISTILAACFSSAALKDGKRIHARMVDSGFEHDVELQTSLISMYGKCGSVKAAAMVFDKKHVQNVGLWNTMLAAYIQHGDAKEAMQLYQCMRNKDLKPDKVTFSTILSACSVLADLPTGKEIHASIRNAGLQSDVVVGTALVNMYAKCGSLVDARLVFDQLHARNAISWNAMIVGHAQTGQAKESVALFEGMRLEGFKTNEITFTNLLYACSHAGLVEEALRFFRIMDEECKITPTLEHYACIIDLLGRVGRLDDAESFIKRYPFQSDSVMWMSLLGACRVHGDIERGRRAADCIFQLDPEKTGPYVLMSNISAAEKS